MSLVNYGSSDESDGNDNEENKQVTSTVASSSSARSLLSSLPPPRSSNALGVDSIGKAVSSQHSSGTMNIKKVTNNTPPVERSSSLNLPAPKKGQTVKITLPSIPDIDEDEPVVKKAKPVPQGTGLFALLPKPKHAVTKEHSRILIPHTLSKRPEKKKPASKKPQTVPSKKTTSSLIQGYVSDDDDDDEPSSFFSFHEKTKESETQNIQTGNETSKSAAVDAGPQDQLSRTAGKEITQSCLQTTHVTPQEIPLSFNVSSSEDTPLCFNPPTSAGTPLDFQHQAVSSSSTSNVGYAASSEPMAYNVPYEYNVPYQEYSQSSENAEQYATYNDEQGQTSEQNYANDEGFKRIQGKKRKKEDIQIIDIQEDHSSYSTAEWLKAHIKEDDKDYRTKLRNEILPTSQQRRKHQITYLAHQAKERELELKNSWAENKMTRKQTQAKYGF